MKLLCFALAAMSSIVLVNGGITILPGGEPKPYKGPLGPEDMDAFYRETAPNEFRNNSAQVLITSHQESFFFEGGVQPSSDSFIRGAIQAWGEHLHLVIRPEEVWFSILVQLTFYMNSHAEEIRSLFVDHAGQLEIRIKDYDWYGVLHRFRNAIQDRVKTDWLMNWIGPDFSTSDDNDYFTASILMMGLTKAYFQFSGGIVCGLPSVTVLGEQSDWENMLGRLDKLSLFGTEPAAYRERLRPILSRFVESFKRPDSEETKLFWNQIVSATPSHVCGGPDYYISGWITGFLFWDDKGKRYAAGSKGSLVLDNQTYPSLDPRTLPIGYARAPFTMLDFEFNHTITKKFPAYVLAGNLAKYITGGPPDEYFEALNRTGQVAQVDKSIHSKLQPLSAWMILGPVDYNATLNWASEPELRTLQSSIKSNFNEKMCALKTGNPMTRSNSMRRLQYRP